METLVDIIEKIPLEDIRDKEILRLKAEVERLRGDSENHVGQLDVLSDQINQQIDGRKAEREENERLRAIMCDAIKLLDQSACGKWSVIELFRLSSGVLKSGLGKNLEPEPERWSDG